MWISTGSTGARRVAAAADRVEDEQHVVAVGVELRPLAELDRVLERDRVQAERPRRAPSCPRRRGSVRSSQKNSSRSRSSASRSRSTVSSTSIRREPTRAAATVRHVTLPVGAYKLEGISPRAYQHPADRAATAALRQVPYLDQVVRKLIELGYERALRAVSLGSSVRLGPGAAAAHLGAAPPGRQLARPRRRAGPLPDAVPVRERDDDRGREADRGAQLASSSRCSTPTGSAPCSPTRRRTSTPTTCSTRPRL